LGFRRAARPIIPAPFIAERLGPALGEPVIVENRPGAASTFTTNNVMSWPRDG
jgi:hypothetical protein